MGIGIKEVRNALYRICHVLTEAKEELTQIDSKLGDGDMGISMEKGAAAIRETLEKEQALSISKLIANCGAAFNRAAPSTLGTLLSVSMLAVAKEIGAKEELEEAELIRFPLIISETIAAKGKAKVGDKTILDALIPFAETLEQQFADNISLGQAWETAAAAAERGMESTKGMTARTGRAKWLDGRNKEYPDAGAVLCVKVVQSLAGFEEQERR